MASEGSFCLVRNGSPSGHFVPVTMLTFGPATGAAANGAAKASSDQPATQIARTRSTETVFIPIPFLILAESNTHIFPDRMALESRGSLYATATIQQFNV